MQVGGLDEFRKVQHMMSGKRTKTGRYRGDDFNQAQSLSTGSDAETVAQSARVATSANSKSAYRGTIRNGATMRESHDNYAQNGRSEDDTKSRFFQASKDNMQPSNGQKLVSRMKGDSEQEFVIGRLNDSFKNTDGRPRASYRATTLEDSSPDELQAPAANGKRADAQPLSPRKRGRQSRSISPTKSLAPLNNAVERSRIKNTTFAGKKLKNRNDDDDFTLSDDDDGEPVRDQRSVGSKGQPFKEEAQWSQPVVAINIPGQPEMLRESGLGLVHNARENIFLLKMNGREYIRRPYRTTIEPKKLLKCFWAPPDEKLRFEHSQSGREYELLEIVLPSQKAVADMLTKVRTEAHQVEVKRISA